MAGLLHHFGTKRTFRVMPYNIADLSSLERTYLGVLALGLPPAKLAGDVWLRLDYLTAVARAGMEGKPPHTYLISEGPETTPAFTELLKQAVYSLEKKDILGTSAPSVVFAFDVGSAAAPDVSSIDPNATPVIFDNFLAQQCMNHLLDNPQVYRFLMGKYAESSEHWQRLTEQGYGQGPHI